MAIIVASLFLPYKPQFEVRATTEEAAELVDNGLAKVDSADTQGRSNSLPANGEAGEHMGTQPEVKARITSEQFLENLTASANMGPPPQPTISQSSFKNRDSADDFFAHADIEDAPVGDGASRLAQEKDFLNAPENPLFASTAVTSTGGNATRSRTASINSTVVTPISRSLPEVGSAVVDVAKIRKSYEQQQSAFPSIQMTQGNIHSQTVMHSGLSSHINNRATSPVTNQASHFGISDILRESDEDETDYESDLETEPNTRYNVPQFGGYSTRAKGNSQYLTNSQMLFGKLPWSIVPTNKGNLSLIKAINTAVAEGTITDKVTWLGTIGIPTDEIPDDISDKIIKKLHEEYNSAAVITDDLTFKGAYKNFSKQILWPTMHYQIPDNPNSKAFEDHSWHYYQKLNQRFAEQIIKVYKDGDTVWINDYHLMLVPNLVREKIPSAKIGFFLHVSFPSSEVFRCLAQRENILQGILGSNFVGFQTKEYARHFLQTCNILLAADVSVDEIKYNGKSVTVGYTPVGIDIFNLSAELKNDQVLQWKKLIHEKWKGKKLIVSRDQFDPIRGLHKKMLAYERFLRENPSYIHKVILLQICIGKNKDSDLERQIMKVVDRINALSSNLSSTPPVVFIHQELDFVQFLALSSEADVFLVSPLREGLNLTSHEFIACSYEKKAPLLLSEFTGSLSVLRSGAILVNPWDVIRVAKKIKYALEMPYIDKVRNWKMLMKNIINHDSDNWVQCTLQNINNAYNQSVENSSVCGIVAEKVYSDYKMSKNHLFILKISEHPTDKMIVTLRELHANNVVFVMSSFSKNTCERLYARVANLGLIAENGAYVRVGDKWYDIVGEVSWKDEILKILDSKVERLPGSYYKVGDSMVRFHTENAEDQDRVGSVIGEAIAHINTLYDEEDVHAYVHKSILFVQQNGLANSALDFILKYYNGSMSSTSSSMAKRFFDFAFISGSSSPPMESLFKCIKVKSNGNELKVGHTVVYGDLESTNANSHIGGSNELFAILDGIMNIE